MKGDRLTIAVDQEYNPCGALDTEPCQDDLDPVELVFLYYEGRFCHLVCLPEGTTEGLGISSELYFDYADGRHTTHHTVKFSTTIWPATRVFWALDLEFVHSRPVKLNCAIRKIDAG